MLRDIHALVFEQSFSRTSGLYWACSCYMWPGLLIHMFTCQEAKQANVVGQSQLSCNEMDTSVM